MKYSWKYLKNSYDKRPTRERIGLIILSWAGIYACFSLFVFPLVDNKQLILDQTMTQERDEIGIWQAHLLELTKVASSKRYRDWLITQETYKKNKEKYAKLVQQSPIIASRQAINTLLQDQSHIKITAIKHLAPTTFQVGTTAETPASDISEQKIQLTLNAQYFDLIHYLEGLEHALPNLRWNSLTYHVTNYPEAEVNMELAIVYENTK